MRAARRALRWGLVAVAGLAVVGLLVHRRGSSCPDTPRTLPALLEELPCPASGHVVYGLRDDHGVAMQVLDPIADPAGGYLGVYHSLVQPWAPAGGIYEVLLAHSDDLVHWHELAVLDDREAAMPALCALPGGAGFMLADEKAAGPPGGHVVRISYFPTRAALLRAQPARAVNLPLRYSPFNDGTPSFRSIRWAGSPVRSTIELAFHYQLPGSGLDREALGTLRGFRDWSTQRDARIDRLLTAGGMPGSHGDQRVFALDGRAWRMYEASATRSGFASWHVLLYLPSVSGLTPLRFRTAAGVFAASFGNPIVDVLPAPDGRGRVLVTTMFVFNQGPAAREAGELLYYWPLPGG